VWWAEIDTGSGVRGDRREDFLCRRPGTAVTLVDRPHCGHSDNVLTYLLSWVLHPPTSRRFGPIALRWATSLLKNCDRPSPGIDLFGARDALLLGRLLSVLGTFAASAADTPAALPLAAGVLELLRAPAVHGHPQVGTGHETLW
jgi:hypothetical protein